MKPYNWFFSPSRDILPYQESLQMDIRTTYLYSTQCLNPHPRPQRRPHGRHPFLLVFEPKRPFCQQLPPCISMCLNKTFLWECMRENVIRIWVGNTLDTPSLLTDSYSFWNGKWWCGWQRLLNIVSPKLVLTLHLYRPSFCVLFGHACGSSSSNWPNQPSRNHKTTAQGKQNVLIWVTFANANHPH